MLRSCKAPKNASRWPGRPKTVLTPWRSTALAISSAPNMRCLLPDTGPPVGGPNLTQSRLPQKGQNAPTWGALGPARLCRRRHRPGRRSAASSETALSIASGDPEGERGRQQLTPRWGGLVLAHPSPPQYLPDARRAAWPARTVARAKPLQLPLRDLD